VPERLSVPWEALSGFFDPSVEFGLKFELQDIEPEEGANDTEPAPRPTALPAPKSPARSDKAPRGAGSEPAEVAPTARPKGKAEAKPEKAAANPPGKPGDGGDPKVISIDAFRKKT
jgi:hypothetical protein